MGSTPHAHAQARVNHPVEQGLAAMVGLFFDTFVVVTMTALVILCTGALDGTTTGISLTQKAFTIGLGTIGNGFVATCLLFFAFTTIIGWYFFGEQNVKYLFGMRWVSIYRVLVLCFIMMGSFLHVTLVWELADLFNGLMVIPNVIALIGLSKVVGKVLEDYQDNFIVGKTPEYGAHSPNGGVYVSKFSTPAHDAAVVAAATEAAEARLEAAEERSDNEHFTHRLRRQGSMKFLRRHTVRRHPATKKDNQ